MNASRKLSNQNGPQHAGLTRRIALLAYAACGAGILACADDPVAPAPLLLKVETVSQSYHIGDTVRVTLENLCTYPIAYNTCLSTLQKWNGVEWLDVNVTGDGLSCTDSQSLLNSGDRTAAVALPFGNSKLALPGTLAPGTYRVQIPTPVLKSLEQSLSGANRISNTFTVS